MFEPFDYSHERWDSFKLAEQRIIRYAFLFVKDGVLLSGHDRHRFVIEILRSVK